LSEEQVNILAVSYFILIHIGLVTWLITFFRSFFRKEISIKVDWTIGIKIVLSIYGVAVGLFLPYWSKLHGPGDVPGYELANIPALIMGSEMSGGGVDFTSWKFFFPYAVLGFIGGWGLGQFIVWIVRKTGQLVHS